MVMALTEPVGCSGFKEDIDRHLNVIRSVKPLHSLVYFCFSLFPSFCLYYITFSGAIQQQTGYNTVTMWLQFSGNLLQFVICRHSDPVFCLLKFRVTAFGSRVLPLREPAA